MKSIEQHRLKRPGMAENFGFMAREKVKLGAVGKGKIRNYTHLCQF